MGNNSFTFKQFTIYHDRCAMKVGTDGVMLGAWTSIYNARRILDVGTGTGLIALQLAQRDDSVSITAIEIDSAAAEQAAENVAASPWADRIEVKCCDFRLFSAEERFDLIVSNPPYFVDALKCPDTRRNTARHADTFNYDLLFRHSARLLTEEGCISIVVPADVEQIVTDAAWRHGFSLTRRCRVFTKPGKPCRRLLLTLGRRLQPCEEEHFCIEATEGGYSREYKALTRDFYLKM